KNDLRSRKNERFLRDGTVARPTPASVRKDRAGAVMRLDPFCGTPVRSSCAPGALPRARAGWHSASPGAHTQGVTPDPISNSAVKPLGPMILTTVGKVGSC